MAFFEDGETPEGDVTGGHMRELVLHGTALLSEKDRAALAAWVMAHEPIVPKGWTPPDDEEDEEDFY